MQKIKPAEVSALLKKQLESANIQTSFDEVGTVLEVGDGIARVYGLTNAEYGELGLYGKFSFDRLFKTSPYTSSVEM